MVYNALGITVTPKDGEMFNFDFCLDSEDAATLNAPRSIDAFKDAKSLKELLYVLDGCFCIDDEICNDDGEMEEVHWTLKKLVDFYDYDDLYPEFKKKVNALKTPDQIACITVFTNNDWNCGRERCYNWIKYDFAGNTVKHGMDTAKAVDSSCMDYEPSDIEMFRILAEK